MRWLLLKDLQILRRSPLQAVLLVAYPVLIAVLVGFAISRGSGEAAGRLPQRSPGRQRGSASAASELPAVGVSDRICKRVECVQVDDRAEAVDEVELRRRAGGADPARRPGRPDQLALDPDPRHARRSKCSSTRRTRSRRGWSTTGSTRCWPRPTWRSPGGSPPKAATTSTCVINGGELHGARPVDPDPRPARTPPRSSTRCAPALPPGPLRDSLDQVIRFAAPGPRQPRHRGAADRPPGAADRGREGGRQRLHPAAGNLRDRRRRDPHPGLRHRPARRRLAGPRARGERLPAADPRPRLAARRCSPRRSCWGSAVGLVGDAADARRAGRSSCRCTGAASASGWSRSSPAARRSAAAGAALGAAAREVRAVSLLAFMVTLPIAFLSLVPSGAVGPGLYDAIRVVAAALPLQAGAAGDDRGARPGRPEHRRGRCSTWRS